jgi:arylsulfatase A-like enzyme
MRRLRNPQGTNMKSTIFPTFTRRRFLGVAAAALGSGLISRPGIASGIGRTRGQEVHQGQHFATASSDAPNVLIIVLDTVRYDRFARNTATSLTPNIDRIVAQGIRYESAWATSSWSLPSQASILTGCYPHQHGADWPKLTLSKQHPTLASLFSSYGYVTGAFSGNSAWITPEYVGRGFLRFEAYTLEDHLRRTGNGRILSNLVEPLGYHNAGRGKKAPAINAQFLRFLDDYSERPFFGYLCYMDVNQGFHYRELNRAFWQRKASVTEILEAYDQALHQLDVNIGELFSELARRGKLDNTLVIITSDHGESFGSAETNDHDPAGHGTSLYPEQTHVPLWIVYPSNLEAGKIIEHPVSLAAIPATIASLLKLENSPFAGGPLPLQESLRRQEDAILTTLNYDNYRLQAVVQENWLLIRNMATMTDECYDLAADPLATNNLIANHARAATLQRSLEHLMASESREF